MENFSQPLYQRITIKLLLLGLIIGFTVMGRELLIPLTIALFFAFLLLPISKKMETWNFPRWLAIIISLIMAVAFFGGLLYFFYTQIISFSDDWPELKKKTTEKMDNIYSFVRENFNISKKKQVSWMNKQLQETADSGDEIAMSIFSATGSFLANLALIPIYIFFITLYREKFKMFMALIIKDGSKENVLQIITKVATVSQKYLKGIFLDVLILSVLSSTGFLLLGLKHAILFGVLAALLNIIPYIGVLIGSVLPVLMALLTKNEIGYAVGAAGVSVLVQFIDNNFITPKVVGSSVSINPLTAIVALVFSAMIWGIPGMILCIPITGMLKVVCDNVESLKPYGFLIGEEVNYRMKKRKISLFSKSS